MLYRSIFTSFSRYLICVFVFVSSASYTHAQEHTRHNAGGTISISATLGSPVNRFGISINAFYFEDFVQANGALRLFYNIRSFGPRKSSWEMQAAVGAMGAWGKNDSTYYLFLSPVSNQTGYRNSAGYAYTFYVDDNQTTQGTGMIGLQVRKVNVIHENDILAGTGSDRFRTGGLSGTWQEDNLRFGISYIGWTGDPKTKLVQRIEDSSYPARRGYKDMSRSTHGKYSHGIVALTAEGILDRQLIRGAAGIDAEQVRNTMQNRFMHELITGGTHYPMLDKEGLPYLYRPGQEIRQPRPYYQWSLNPPVFY